MDQNHPSFHILTATYNTKWYTAVALIIMSKDVIKNQRSGSNSPWSSGGAITPTDNIHTGFTHKLTFPTILTQTLQNVHALDSIVHKMNFHYVSNKGLS